MADTKRAVLIVDGAYLLTAGRNHGGPLDYSSQNIENMVKLLEKSCGFSFSDAYWFDAMVIDPKTKTQLYEQKQLTSSLQLNQFKVMHKGFKSMHVRCPNQQCSYSRHPGIPKTVQAGVDVAIATKMMELVCEGMMDVLVLVAGDGDFLEALKYVAENKRKTVYLAGFDGSMSQVLQSYASRGCIIRLNEQWPTLAYMPPHKRAVSPVPSPRPSVSDPPPTAPAPAPAPAQGPASVDAMATEPAAGLAGTSSSELFRQGMVAVWTDQQDDLIPPTALMGVPPPQDGVRAQGVQAGVVEGERRPAEEARGSGKDEGLKGSQIRALVLNRPSSSDPASPPLSGKWSDSGDDVVRRLQWEDDGPGRDTDEAQRRLLGTLDLLLQRGSQAQGPHTVAPQPPPTNHQRPAQLPPHGLLPHPPRQPPAPLPNNRPGPVPTPPSPASPRRPSDHNPPRFPQPGRSMSPARPGPPPAPALRYVDDRRGQPGLLANPVLSQPLPDRSQPDSARMVNPSTDSHYQRYPTDPPRGPAPSGGPPPSLPDRSRPEPHRPEPNRMGNPNRDYQHYPMDPPPRGPAPSGGPPLSLPTRTLPDRSIISLPDRHLPDRSLNDPTRMANTGRDYVNQRYPADPHRGPAPSGGPPSSPPRIPHNMGMAPPQPNKFYGAPPQPPPVGPPAVIRLPALPGTIPLMPTPPRAPLPGSGDYLLLGNRNTEHWQGQARTRPRTELPPRLQQGKTHARATVDGYLSS